MKLLLNSLAPGLIIAESVSVELIERLTRVSQVCALVRHQREEESIKCHQLFCCMVQQVL